MSRPATHSGSWYLSNPSSLSQQLGTFFTEAIKENGGPVKGTRAIISPHAGYSYCGETMAKAYAKLDITDQIKRVFILGPSHHFYFKNKGLISRYEVLETPLGSLKVDVETVEKLLSNPELFANLDQEADQDEHSLEMQYPMWYQTLIHNGLSPSKIGVVPILISHNSTKIDYTIGKCLLEYLKSGDSIFIISSDFCHWGRRFGYTGYVSSHEDIADAIAELTEIETLTTRSKLDHHCLKIYKSIELLDRYAMDILAQKNGPKDTYAAWKEYLEVTGNTICGEKPTGVFLCLLSYLNTSHPFKWSGYSQSSNVESLDESSVSYAAGYCVV
ncbi:Mho1p Ecym_4787 [Eremothecium cymbalariae DBVPG|uniref:AmmeMemoRadiSam system protein B n=1 Tax=Eremothecium cymbalariae (strain CBS 270.75 / DBVPG 7215 / KCTC 17166 / NRRL Y-17582) TaxID=931890 RepID=G8JSS6_ERECY|nr:hypothetical protein Ecym_4787 [Eremothecium cymbalariae DBVPG\